MREGPPFCDQAPVPSEQCGWRDHERPSAFPSETSARRGEAEPIDRRQYGTLALPTREWLVRGEDDDFQFFEVVLPHPQGSELENPTQHQVAERNAHEASCVVNSIHRLVSPRSGS